MLSSSEVPDCAAVMVAGGLLEGLMAVPTFVEACVLLYACVEAVEEGPVTRPDNVRGASRTWLQAR